MPLSLLFNWRIWAAVALGICLAATHWKVYKLGEQNVQMRWDAEKLQVAAQTIQIQADNDKKSASLQAEKEKIRKVKNAEIDRLNSNLADALERLHNRPSRDSSGDLSSNPSVGSSCTGASLFRDDSEFLTRLAARADRERLDLLECQGAYAKARSAVNGN